MPCRPYITSRTAPPATAPVAVAPAFVAGGGRSRQTPGIIAWLLLLAVMFAGTGSSAAEPRVIGEYELKAAFVAKLPAYTIWPDYSFPSTTAPLTIGILGESRFGPHLENVVRDKINNGHPLVVKACRDASEAAQCQVVFLFAEGKELEDALRLLAGLKVLTVSDSPGFAALGGMVGLTLAPVDKKVQLEVNLEEVQKSGLRMDPRFLQLVKIVKRSRPAPKP